MRNDMRNETETHQTTENGEESLLPTETPNRPDNAALAPVIPRLTEDTKRNAVTLFARGYAPPVIVDILLETPPAELTEAVLIVPAEALRRDLLSQLRSCNPADRKFAGKLYEDYYREHRRAFHAAISAKSHQVAEQQLAVLETVRNDALALIAQSRDMLSKASEEQITGNTEFTKTAALMLAAQKTLIAAGDEQLKILENIKT